MKRSLISISSAALVLLSAAAFGDTFTKHSKWLTVGPNPNSIVAVDLNGDKLPEIVTADTGRLGDPSEERPANDQLSYLVATGNLNYEPEPQLHTGFAPYCVVAADLDGTDGLDLIAGNFIASRERDVSLFQNLGNNLFEPTHVGVPKENLRYSRVMDGDKAAVFTVPGITALVVRDIDHDGKPDLIATGWSCDALIYFPGAPRAFFGSPTVTPAPGGPRDLDVADLDGDGALDVVAAMYNAGELAIWKGDGKGRFARANHFPSRGRLPHKVQVKDVNKDGKLDLIVSHCREDDSVVVFFGNGAFDFSISQEILLGEKRDAVEAEIRDMLVDDLNGDGKPDIALACFASRQVVVLFNESKSSGTPQTFRKETYSFDKARPRALCVGDFNQDGKHDLGVALWEANAVALLLGK